MKGLTFRAQYVPLILAGEKFTTIRRPSNRLPVQGERIRLVCRYDRPPFALATVLAVVDVTMAELTPSDARADGFDSLAELVDALRAHAGQGGPDALPAMPAPLWRIITFAIDSTT